MNKAITLKEFQKSVTNKFNLYNSLFLNLPYSNISSIGMLIPILHQACKAGLDNGQEPKEIIASFFKNQTQISTEKEQIDFMFRVIQYVERQVVLYDSVEDAAFVHIQKLNNDLSIKDFFNHPKSAENAEPILAKMSDFSARIVFTAHPTQFYPPAVLDIISKLRTLIPENNINQIDLSLQQLGLTSFVNTKKPSPLDEAKHIIYFMRNVYYDAIAQFYATIKNTIPNKKFENTNVIKLGFWPGGDRDGNPFVTAKTTQAVADELRMNLMKCYYADIRKLRKKLTFRKVENSLVELKNKLYKTMFDTSQTLNWKDILTPIVNIKNLVTEHYNGLYTEEINDLIYKIQIFKTHFASLDIRQDHSIHHKVITAILKKEQLIKENLSELSREKLINILLEKELNLNPEDFEDTLIKDTIQNISILKTIQDKNGEEGCNRYIISNSEDIFSVLFVFALFKWSGWEKNQITFDIIPLFETMKGMKESDFIMRNLFEITDYRNHVNFRNNRQTLMLGFSDGTKDGGYLKANWSIFKTKEKLSAICEQNNIKALFFDGRGGPPARGGGKTHRFYASQSHNIASHEIQMTVQGQTITSKYGTKDQFTNNCEQLLTAGLLQTFSKKENAIPANSRQLIENLSQLSYEKYTDLKNHEMFIPYLENKSTLKYYGTANIGSRPAKRGHKAKLELTDLRAISYVGSWSQLKQNVPGYFGLGTAIETLVAQGKSKELKQLFTDIPFFKALILNSMMSLTKSYFELTAYIKKDKKYTAFWTILHEEYKLSKAMLLFISGYEKLMEEELISRSSIAIREKIVLPLLVIQQYALQKIEENSNYKSTYEKL